MKFIKQYGIQRSGTNFLRAILELNFDCRILSNIGGIKHGRITNKTDIRQVKTDLSEEEIDNIDIMLQLDEIPKIVITKNVFAWIVSISKYLNKPITETFINEQLKRYIELNTHWIEECDMIVTYEELIICPEITLNTIGTTLDLSRISKEIIIPKNRMHRGGDTPTETIISKQKFNIDYYKNNQYMKELTEEQINQINSYGIERISNN